ncbi:hypothetical protein BCU68_16625 [Vibrio sp. 10N.286.49.B3]|uniref:acyltransferase n=1 Tax=Vibrio sp. 10N.286.49.B3 TaxID=1880855 RepID=UPI000C8623F2|nr:acyltransferase [Vibrio sp. 10N.286.49.B3]PMH38390.1 hypothetical protein BCU68_16625 [Vibrio sp. 10N.286.49.B3]
MSILKKLLTANKLSNAKSLQINKSKSKNKSKQFSVKGQIKKNSINIGDSVTLRGENTINFWRESSNNIVSIGSNFTCDNLKIVFKGDNNKLLIDDNVRWVGHILIVGNNRTVRIGENTTAQGVYILSRDENVIIGKNCMFSREVEVRSTDVHKIYCLESGERLNHASPIVVSDNVWVAARAILSKGTTIPSGCIVGASSFVNKSFTDKNTIIAGTPAKIVKRNIRWQR